MVYQFVSHIHIEEVLPSRFWQELLLRMASGAGRSWFIVHRSVADRTTRYF
jgi:hypothetical protein